jgi:hypothetical protein
MLPMSMNCNPSSSNHNRIPIHSRDPHRNPNRNRNRNPSQDLRSKLK